METQTTNWIDTELANIQANQPSGDRLPSLVLEENKIAEIEIDFSKPFDTWIDKENNSTKKIIPCTNAGVKKAFWVNVRNPLFGQLLNKGKAGQTKFRVLRSGQAKQTRYTLIEG